MLYQRRQLNLEALQQGGDLEHRQAVTPFNKIELEDRELSEDLSFCYRWTKQCGGRLYANIHHPIAHMSSMELTTCYGDSL